MFKKAIIVSVSVLSVAFAGTIFAADIIVLKRPFGDVTLLHKAHQERLKNCDACHKLFAKEAGSIEKSITAGTLTKKDAMNVCVACHKADKAKGSAAGPVVCKECHKKQP